MKLTNEEKCVYCREYGNLPCDECNKKLEAKKAMSKRLEEIKNEYAESKGWDNWSDFIGCVQITRREEHFDKVSELYAREAAQASLEKAYGKACINLELCSYEYEALEQSITNPDNIVLP